MCDPTLRVVGLRVTAIAPEGLRPRSLARLDVPFVEVPPFLGLATGALKPGERPWRRVVLLHGLIVPLEVLFGSKGLGRTSTLAEEPLSSRRARAASRDDNRRCDWIGISCAKRGAFGWRM